MGSSADSSATIIRPHPVLPRYYEAEDHRQSFVERLFDDSAAHYDRLERLMSLGAGRWYRRQALKRAGLRPGMKVLDVAIGTGLVAREALRIMNNQGSVVGLDPSAGMLSRAARSLPVHLVQGRAEGLPFAANSFDFLSMGYALRHVSDLAAALRQFMSVLRPGGILLMLEITAPRRGLGRAIMGDYVSRLIPTVSKVLPERRSAENPNAGRLLLKYYWDTVTHCISPDAVLQTMNATGFSSPKWWAQFGILSEYTAVKPG